MPPPGSTNVRPSQADIDSVAAFLDDPFRFPPQDLISCEGQSTSFDEIYDKLQGDIISVDSEDLEFTRYVLLSNRYNQGDCSAAVLRDRHGMNKMLNMLSIESRTAQAVPINREETIYRLDVRQLGWDREIEVNGEGFADGWDAIAALNRYAVQFQGDEAEQVILQAQTEIT